MTALTPDQRDPQTYQIIGAAFEVHREMSCGFLEYAYQEALAIEFELRGIPFRREVDLPLYYKGRMLKCVYRADFVCFESVIVETKALKTVTDVERAQLINYLRITRFERGLVLNFGCVSLQHERFANSLPSSAQSAKSAVPPS
jgi:GxxExxY protein